MYYHTSHSQIDPSSMHARERILSSLIYSFTFYLYLNLYYYNIIHYWACIPFSVGRSDQIMKTSAMHALVPDSVVQTDTELFFFIYFARSLVVEYISRCRSLCSCSALRRLELATCWYYIGRCSSLSVCFLVSACSPHEDTYTFYWLL